jgi:polysaccharide biosynthesis transport protein
VNIRELLAGIRRHLVLLMFALFLGGGIAQGITMLLPKTYTSKSSVFVSVAPSTQRLDQAYQGTLFSQQQVRSYADLVTTPTVTAPVVRELGLHIRPETLAKRLSVEVPLDTVLLNISARDRNPARAARIASSVTQNLVSTVSALETSQAQRTPTVRLHVVRPGSVPAGPSSPKPVLNIAIGLVLGAMTGVAAGAVKDALDTRIGSAEDLARALGGANQTPSLGDIPYDGAARKHPLVHDADPFGSRAEAFRKLRTNLRFIGVDRPPRTIVISSPNTGDGKSSAALNLAFSLADDGARVVLVDADLRRPSIASSLGLVEGAGLTSVLSGQAGIADVMQRAERQSVIDVMTSGPVPPNPSELLGAQKMRLVLEELADYADYVIVDSPPLGPVTDAAVVASGADGVLVVVRAGRTKRDELRAAVASLHAVNANTLGLVVNMTKPGKGDRYRYYGGAPGHGPGSPAIPPRSAVG